MQYFRPHALTEALSVLDGGIVRIAAGCTDLFAATSSRDLPGPVLDVTGVEGLRGITRTDAHIRIGAATTWTDILRADLPASFDGLKKAAREIGSVQIQNVATIAGNICNASPAADSLPPLLTLDASVELTSSSGTRILGLADFVSGARTTSRAPSELVTALLIPHNATAGRSTFLKLGARKYLVISIAMVAARLETVDSIVAECAVSVGACSAVAVRLAGVEAALAGRHADAHLADRITPDLVGRHLSPIDDVRGDVAYRTAAATELVRRAIAELVLPTAGSPS